MMASSIISFNAYAERPSITSLQQQINVLNAELNQQQAQIDALESAAPTPILKVYAGDIFLGYHISESNEQILVFEPSSGFFVRLISTNESDNTVISINRKVIYFENLDCDGAGIVINSNDVALTTYSDTLNILFMNGETYYKTIGVYDGPRNIFFQSRFEPDGSCTSGFSEAMGNQNGRFEQTEIPLPYSFPITVPHDGLRLDFVNP